MGKDLNELDSRFYPLAVLLLNKAEDAGLAPVVEDTGRTEGEQRVKLSSGVSWTTRSKHLPQPPEGKSQAIDIVPKACIPLKYWGWNGTVADSHPHWGALIALARTIPGIHCGADFRPPGRPDPGHFELAASFTPEVT